MVLLYSDFGKKRVTRGPQAGADEHRFRGVYASAMLSSQQ